MPKFFFAALLLTSLTLGCGKPPEPTGPAAEAMTDDIEITVDEPGNSPEAPTVTK